MNGQLQVMMERDVETITSLQKDAKDKDSVSEHPQMLGQEPVAKCRGGSEDYQAVHGPNQECFKDCVSSEHCIFYTHHMLYSTHHMLYSRHHLLYSRHHTMQ